MMQSKKPARMAEKQTVLEKSIPCKRCGKIPSHSKFQCPARQAYCNLCKKKGYYAKVCRSRGISEVNMTGDEQEDDMAFLGTVSTEQNDAPWLIKLKVNDSEVLFKVDTGADVTVVSEDLFKQENFGKLQKTSKILLGPGQDSLQVKGEPVWISDTKQKGTVIMNAETPRSYLVDSPKGILRRNRSHIVSTPVAGKERIC
ncbi:hypothetical protein DPX16_5737 [Anabarilius grahami]|uniref:Peptidase A2 domain-containing protein n=1 Tax=Anabarilius grahami TaxID=495550 RepID=A0A3N0Z9V9_ANAGA|nr:hypothetical protein DPX16_5737 [Anabarilius grahami]